MPKAKNAFPSFQSQLRLEGISATTTRAGILYQAAKTAIGPFDGLGVGFDDYVRILVSHALGQIIEDDLESNYGGRESPIEEEGSDNDDTVLGSDEEEASDNDDTALDSISEISGELPDDVDELDAVVEFDARLSGSQPDERDAILARLLQQGGQKAVDGFGQIMNKTKLIQLAQISGIWPQLSEAQRRLFQESEGVLASGRSYVGKRVKTQRAPRRLTLVQLSDGRRIRV